MISSARLILGKPMTPFSSAKGESGSKEGVNGLPRGTTSLRTPPVSADAVCAVVCGVYGLGSSFNDPAVCRLAILDALAFSRFVAACNPDNPIPITPFIVL